MPSGLELQACKLLPSPLALLGIPISSRSIPGLTCQLALRAPPRLPFLNVLSRAAAAGAAAVAPAAATVMVLVGLSTMSTVPMALLFPEAVTAVAVALVGITGARPTPSSRCRCQLRRAPRQRQAQSPSQPLSLRSPSRRRTQPMQAMQRGRTASVSPKTALYRLTGGRPLAQVQLARMGECNPATHSPVSSQRCQRSPQ
mmetsp:Transcript_5242/g.15022  ORF Transcript_5242/g.15022 Transcript_5242/m.15022 type:complete len:200 (-) Transcript_5242:1298-1897(-)